MKIKTMFKAILSLAVCLMVVSVISVAVSAAEYEEIKMDVSVSSSATYNKYQIDIPHDGHIILYFDISCEYNYQTVITLKRFAVIHIKKQERVIIGWENTKRM